jgi:hypothetical protein
VDIFLKDPFAVIRFISVATHLIFDVPAGNGGLRNGFVVQEGAIFGRRANGGTDMICRAAALRG